MRNAFDFFPWLKKIFLRRLTPVIGILIASGLSMGGGDSWDTIRQGAKEIQTVQADFTQEKQMKILSSPLVSQGKFYFKMPDSLRWEYTEPIQSVLMMDQGRTRRYMKGRDGWTEDEASRLQAMQVAIGEITQWISGNFDKNKEFSASLSPEREIILVPRQEGLAKIIQRIVLKLSDTPGLMESVSIYENEDSFTRITFHDAVLNQPFDAEVFKSVE